jgi:hypothetical protein
MPCKVGITTAPIEKTLEWRVKYPGFANWRILGCHRTRNEAQLLVESFASNFQCDAFGLNEKPIKAMLSWYVYYFEC